MLSSNRTVYWQRHFSRYLEQGTPLPPTLLQPEAEDEMEVPYVQVILTAASRNNEIDRTLRLDAINRVIKVGRASSRSACADSALDNNCYLKSPIVSRNHGRFIIGDRAHPLKLVDDGSTHGTFVNSIKLIPKQEFTLDNNSKVTFGNEIIHGNCNYSPTVFRVSYIWHDPVIPDTFPFWSSRLGIRAPTPESDSEEEETGADVDTQTPYARSPSVIVLDSPPCIDLTGDQVSDSGHQSVDQDVLSTTANHEDEPVEPPWKSNDQDNKPVVKETNSRPEVTKSIFRLNYADSDPEDGLESASQSSPPARDFDSLYDDSDDSNVSSPPQSHHSDEIESEKDDTSSEGEVGLETDDEEIMSEYSQQAHEKDDESGNDTDGTGEDVLEQNDGGPSATADKKILTSFEQSLQWLGASEHDKAETIVQLFQAKTNADPDVQSIALECVQVIAEETPNEDLASKLEYWLDTGSLSGYWETDCSGPRNVATVSEILTMELPPVPMMPPIPRTNHTSQIHMPDFESSLFTSHSSDRFPAQITSTFSGQPGSFRDFPFTSAPTWHGCTAQPSPVMQISNLVDKVSAELLPTTPNTLPPRSEENLAVVGSHETRPNQRPEMRSKTDVFEGMDRELYDKETAGFGQQKELESVREEASFSLAPACSRQKRKLGDTDLEEQETVVSEIPATSSVFTTSSPFQNRPHEAQPSGLQFARPVESDGLQILTQNTDEVPVLGDVAQKFNQERGQPQRQKRKIIAESHPRASVLKTIATHCIAGAVGAIGLVAAIVATTPTQLKEELLYQKA